MTNKTKLTAAALFSAVLLGGSFATTSVFAADALNTTPGADVNSADATGHAYVTFTKNGTNPIIDPSDPGSTLTPSNPSDVTGQTGELTLDAIPSSLNFGTQEAKGAGQVVQLLASNDTAAANNPLSAGKDGDGVSTSDHAIKDGRVIFTQVTNVATTNPTWTLSAKMGDFTNKDGNTLKDAFITFGGGVNVLDKYDTTTKTQSWIQQTGDDALATDQTLVANGGSTQFATSKLTGTFQQQWNVKDVTLTTPEAPTKGDYTADITWTLTAAPAAITTTEP